MVIFDIIILFFSQIIIYRKEMPNFFPQQAMKSKDFKKQNATKDYVKQYIDRNTDLSHGFVDQAETNASYDSAHMLNSTGGVLCVLAGHENIINHYSLRGYFKNPANAGSVICRLIVFQWKIDNGQTPPTDQLILDNATAVNAVLGDILSKDLRSYKRRMNLLADRTFVLGEANSVEGEELKMFNINISGKKLIHVRSSDSNDGIGNIFALALSNVAEASTLITLLTRISSDSRVEPTLRDRNNFHLIQLS